MPEYLAEQIRVGALDYTKIVNMYPEYKDDIDQYLNNFNLIPEED